MSLDALELVYEQKSKIQTICFYENKDKQLLLTLDTYAQFLEGDDLENYHDTITKPAFEMNFNSKDFLILGGGDGLVARNIFRLNPYAKITLIDIDNDLVNLFMEVPRLRKLNEYSLYNCVIYCRNALNWVSKCKDKFDIIVCDFPDGNNKELKKLYKKEFLADVVKLLNKNGIISIQTHIIITSKIEQIIKQLLGNSKKIKYTMPYLGQGNIVLGEKLNNA